MKTRITLLLLFITFYLRSAAQEIRGNVTDPKKEPLINCTVQVKQNGILKGGGLTDFDGNYSVKPLDTGSYEVTCSYMGYQTKTVKEVIVTPGAKTQLNVVLIPSGKCKLHEVIVNYKKPLVDKCSNSHIVTAEAIKRKPTNQVANIVALSPGVYQSQRGKALTYNGSENTGNKYVIDGVQVSGNINDMARGYTESVTAVQDNLNRPVYLDPSEESYKKTTENDFMTVSSTPLSTMSVDVDRASYSNVRRFINEGQKPPVDAVRIEEMINYFDYEYPQPEGKDPIAIETELTDCPWQKGHKMLHIGIQAKTADMKALPPSNLVFLIDVSGSMMEPAKLPLLKSALRLLVNNLRPQDKVSLVAYAGNAGLVLPPTSGSKKEMINNAIDRLEGGGSTAGGAGIKLAYSTAVSNFIKRGNNRVLLCTDGDFNVGVSSDNELEDLITKERESGVFLTCLGFGEGNYKDSKMEMLADKGNGNYDYIDNIQEAQKTLVNEFGGTLFTVAKDVKCQIEFNPAKVQAYRLVGYENRLLNTEDFKDDKKDAGDMGSGHTVTVIYEIIPAGITTNDVRPVDELKYQKPVPASPIFSNELATIKFRYKTPDGNVSTEIDHTVTSMTTEFSKASDNTTFSASVAMFGMLLKDSKFKGSSSYDMVQAIAKNSMGKDKEGYRSEFQRLVKAVAAYDTKTTAK